MKKLMYIFVAVIGIMVAACDMQVDDNVPDENIDKGEVALEIFSHLQRVEKIVYLNENKHSKFITPEIRSLIAKDKRARMQVSQSTNEPDTVFSLSEIPIYKEETSYSRIYTTGAVETENTDITPANMNPVYEFTATPLPPEMIIKKTVVKNGKITAYNANMEVISSEPYVETNMKEFLDTISYYIHLAEEYINNADGIQRAPAKNRLKEMNLPAGSSIAELANGNYVIEQELDNQLHIAADGKQKAPFAGKLHSRTELAPELDKTLQFQLLQGEQLLERRCYFYAERDELKNSAAIDGRNIYNPEMIISESLDLSENGVPMIRTVQEYYVTHKIVFHPQQKSK